MPTSPNAAGLGEYGNIPISLYTGLPNISIPLWNLKGREIDFDVSLSYRASGVKVEDNASWVGMGWSLNAGGVITRVIRDKPDFQNGLQSRPILPLPASNLMRYDTIQYYSYMKGVVDMEPDVFNYNFNGKSGSFVFDRSGVARFNQFDDLKIRYERSVNVPGHGWYGQFIITTGNGTVYKFNERETSSQSEEPSSWFLTTITSASGREVFNLVYENEQFGYHTAERHSIYTSLGTGAGTIRPWDNAETVIHGKRLKEINTNTLGKIVFVPQTQARKDLGTYAYALKDIEIYTSQNEMVKKFRFETEDIETSIRFPLNNPTYGNAEYINWRLYLKSVTELSANEALSKPPYIFTYFDRDANGKDLLPHRVSFAQDHWGYYNGKNSNGSLTPAYHGPFGYNYQTGEHDPQFDAFLPICSVNDYLENYDYSYAGLTGDRSSSFPSMRAGTIKSIHYPTGGLTEFDFEAHYGRFESQDVTIKYSGIVGGLRVKSITSLSPCNEILSKKEYEYAEGGLTHFPKYRTYTYNNGLGEPNGSQPGVMQICTNNPNGDPYIDKHLYVTINPGSFTFPGATKGSSIGYNIVREVEVGNGSTTYTYTSPLSHPDEHNSTNLTYIFRDPFYQNYIVERELLFSSNLSYPYFPMKDNDWKRGLLINKDSRDLYGKILTSEAYEYTMEELGNVPALAILEQRRELDFYYALYKVPYGWCRLDKKTITNFDKQQSIGQQQVYTYNYEPLHKYKIKESLVSSKGDTMSTTYTYPFNYSIAPYTYMTDRHILTPVIETKQFKNETELSSIFTVYKDWLGDQTVFAPEIIKTKFKENGTPEARVRYHELNADGGILSVSKENGIKTSYIWDNRSLRPTAEVKNANPEDIAYTSFEVDGFGNWQYNNASIVIDSARTGQRSFSLSSNYSVSKSGLNVTKGYIITYWSKAGAYQVNGSTANPLYTINGWTLYEHKISGASSCTVTGSGLIDELRLHPENSTMQTFSYHPLYGINSTCDEANRVTTFEYDVLGRLIIVKDNSGNITKRIAYNYADTATINCNQQLIYNSEKSRSFTKSNCLIGQTGETIRYTVSAKTFSSYIPGEADARAQSIIDTYGQSYVNNIGTCKYYNDDQSGNYTAVGCPEGFNATTVYVSSPANVYESAISKEDANIRARYFAQSYANERGCVPGSVTIIGSNSNAIPNFKVKLTNLQNNVVYEYDLIAATLATIPPGPYTINIYNPYNTSTVYNFSADGLTMSGTSATFVSVNLSTFNVTVSIEQ
ncbi:DUF5977 domain-containing protein [Mucilaginibacter sp. PAMB04168]|uniref:DUF5977 domain-containing protein n=1 Tax=Mucilaginibacter sp. PAMB04168 TaxID=3138567 RepID=UPI0031F70BD9